MKTFFTTLAIFIFLSLTTSSFAVSPSPTATDTSTPTDSPTTIQEKIRTLVRDNLATTESKLKEKIDQSTLVGYSGEITEIKNGNVTISTPDGALEATTDSNTVIVIKGAVSKLDKLAIGNRILIIGTSVKKDILEAKRIILSPEAPTKPEIFLAEVSELNAKTKTISFTGNKTVFNIGRKMSLRLKELAIGQKLIVVTKTLDGSPYLTQFKLLP